MRTRASLCGIAALLCVASPAQRAVAPNVSERDFLCRNAPVKVLEHLHILDGTGRPALKTRPL